jgi:hypothetical protein
MKVYSDILTREDLYVALPADVYADVRNINTRKRARGWEVHLEGLGARHTRKRNSGNYGAGHEMAATWDDHGVWMAALYEIDPLAQIACYSDRDNFYESTEHEMTWRRDARRGVRAEAPWLGVTA